MDHLSQETALLLNLSQDERIQKVLSNRWIGYPVAQRIIHRLEDLLIYPKSHRMPNLLIVGDTNNGKTMIVRKFCKSHPSDDNVEGDHVKIPVLYIQAPPVPDEGRFYNAILEALFAPYKTNDRIDKKQFQVIRLLRYIDVKILIIDEIHHILAGNLNRQRGFLNVIKYLGNELQIPIVGVGTKDAYRALQTEPQLANRFEPAVLPRWKLDKDFLRLLMSFERLLPLKEPSNLHDMDIANKIYGMSEGYIGEVSNILTQAAVKAIQNKSEKIKLKLLKELIWTSPSGRKTLVDKFKHA